MKSLQDAQDTFANKRVVLTAVVHAHKESQDKALKIASTAIERRLENLNNAAESIHRIQISFLSRAMVEQTFRHHQIC